MDWNQIETKWSAMARRIRADAPCGPTQETTLSPDQVGQRAATKGVVVNQGVAARTGIPENCKTELAR